MDGTNLAQAISLAALVHQDQYDKGGEPYILHCIRVMSTVRTRMPKGEEAAIVAVLHDTIEDYEFETMQQPLAEYLQQLHDQFGPRVLNDVEELSKSPGEDYLGSYIPRIIEGYPRLKVIKMADLEDNLQPLRQPTLQDKDLLRLQKYHMAYRMLRGET